MPTVRREPTPEELARRQADMRCQAVTSGSTTDAVVEQCQEPIVYVLGGPNGNGRRTVGEDPGRVPSNTPPGHWSKYDKIHRDKMLRNRANDKRNDDGNRVYGPQVILNHQTADPWIDPVEGGARNRG